MTGQYDIALGTGTLRVAKSLNGANITIATIPAQTYTGGHICPAVSVWDKRHAEMPEGSYTTSLFQSGVNKMAQKVGEEAVETVIEACNGTDERLIYEGADLLYHLIVLLTSKGYRIEDLARELEERHSATWKKH